MSICYPYLIQTTLKWTLKPILIIQVLLSFFKFLQETKTLIFEAVLRKKGSQSQIDSFIL